MAVYTEVSDDELAELIAKYAIGEVVSFKGIAEGVENTNYLVVTTGGRFILTLYEKRVATADLPYFLGLMEHLARRGISCPTPVHDQSGATLTEVQGRSAALVTFLDGISLGRPGPEHCRAVGETLARLHIAGQDYAGQRRNALGHDGWRPLFEKFATRADEITTGLRDLISGELDGLDRAWPAGLPSGVIHADLFPDNVFFLDGRLSGLIDFYFACNDWLAYDLAVCLSAWGFNSDHTYNRAKGGALIDGYQAVRPLEARERTALPILARGAALRFLLTRSFDWLNRPINALVKPHDPMDYVARLKFHQSVRSIADYGVEASS
ncbi:MAG: homoserine kinase [Hyphomicrobium sp.]|nr:homoserine kinase [Hyphomicrobium sp.]